MLVRDFEIQALHWDSHGFHLPFVFKLLRKLNSILQSRRGFEERAFDQGHFDIIIVYWFGRMSISHHNYQDYFSIEVGNLLSFN